MRNLARVNPRLVLCVVAVLLIAASAFAAGAAWAVRAARLANRSMPVVRYSGPLSGELIEDAAPLRQVLPEVNLASMTLGQAIDALRRQSDANIFVNWRRLDELSLGISPDMPLKMDLRLKGVTLGQALAKVLECAEPRRPPDGGRILGFGVRDGIITVSDDWASSASIGRWYYVQDLLNDPAHFSADAPAVTSPGLFASAASPRQDAEDRLLQIITESVDVESWRDNGGAVGSIRTWAGRLVIHQTAENHEKIESLLASLRKGR